MHKLRRAMVRPGRERLTGLVEVDETYWGAEEEGVIGRQTERKALIAVAAHRAGAHPHAARSERLGGQFDALRRGVGRAGQRGCYPTGRATIRSRRRTTSVVSSRLTTAASRAATAEGALGDLATQALDAGHASGGGQPRASGLLSRRVRVPLQSAQITQSGQALLPPCAAGHGGGADAVPLDRRRLGRATSCSLGASIPRYRNSSGL